MSSGRILISTREEPDKAKKHTDKVAKYQCKLPSMDSIPDEVAYDFKVLLVSGADLPASYHDLFVAVTIGNKVVQSHKVRAYVSAMGSRGGHRARRCVANAAANASVCCTCVSLDDAVWCMPLPCVHACCAARIALFPLLTACRGVDLQRRELRGYATAISIVFWRQIAQTKGVAHWKELLKPVTVRLPIDPTQQPDTIVYLCRGEKGNDRWVVQNCFG